GRSRGRIAGGRRRHQPASEVTAPLRRPRECPTMERLGGSRPGSGPDYESYRPNRLADRNRRVCRPPLQLRMRTKADSDVVLDNAVVEHPRFRGTIQSHRDVADSGTPYLRVL